MSSPLAAASPAGTLAIDIRQLPWIRRLAADYAFAFDAVAPFYAGDPRSDADWQATIATVQRFAARRSSRLVEIVHAQQRIREAPPEAVEAARRLGDAATVAVVTGQQAGLFGGPLYTLHKAITAIKLATSVSRRFNVTAVPVFWIDAEDHDWEEVRRCTILDGEHDVRRIEMATLDGAGERSVGRLVLLEQGRDAIASLSDALAPTEFTEELLSVLSKAYAQGQTMASAFGRVLEHALGRHGLVVFDASDEAAKPLVASVFARALTPPGATSRLASEAGAALEQRGYHAQVTTSEHAAPLFSVDGGRAPVHWQGNLAVVGDLTRPLADQAADAAARPQAYSPNVLLRPIVQDTIFPTVSYVGGPAEVAYFAQLKGIYGHFGVPMPLVTPRASASIVDSATLRALHKHDVPFPGYQRQDESTAARCSLAAPASRSGTWPASSPT